ncbi:MAG: DUF4249 domain-containing protein [Bacteroidota bacterium]
MQTKISVLILFAFLIFTSCQDVVDLEVPDGDVQLVVDGWLTDQVGEKQVVLSLTANYFTDGELPRVTDAVVELKNENNAVATLVEKEPGIYVTDYVGEVGLTYHLYIRTSEGAEYQSNPELLRAVPTIDSIYYEYKEESVFEDEGYYISIDTREPLGVGDHYRWKQYVNDEYLNEPFDLLYASDEFVDGNPIIGFEINEDPLELEDSFRVEQLSISEAAFEFFSQVQLQTAFVGSLFDSPPAPIEGNIVNLNPDGPEALGFFGVSAVSTASTVIK